MKAYLAIKYYPDNSNKELIIDLTKKLENSGIETISAVKDIEQWGKKKFTPQKLMELCFHQIDFCDMLIVEFSEKGVGLGIEAGYGYAKKHPIYVVAKEQSNISETIKGIAKKIMFYEKTSDLTSFFEEIFLQFKT